MEFYLWMLAWWCLCVMIGVPAYIIFRFCKMLYKDFLVVPEKTKDPVEELMKQGKC